MHSAHSHAVQVLNLDTTFFDKNFDRENCPELQNLLLDPSKPDEQYPIWASILFSPGDIDRWFPFQSPALPTVRVIPSYCCKF